MGVVVLCGVLGFGTIIFMIEKGKSVVVIEHNLEVIKTADWIIDIGPEGGHKGGKVIAEGTPEDVVNVKGSYTGQYMKPLLDKKQTDVA